MPLWKLWRALYNPPADDPYFQQMLRVTGGLAPWYVLLAEGLLLLLFVPLLVMAALVYGMAWTVTISGRLHRERRSGRFDLLSLSPGGPLPAAWALALGCLHANQNFITVNRPGVFMSRLALLVIILVPFSQMAGIPDALQWLLLALRCVALVAFLLVDQAGTVLLSILLGLATPLRTGTRADAQLLAFVLFLAVELGVYGLVFFCAFVLLPSAGLPEMQTSLLQPVLSVLLLLALRLLPLLALWRWLVFHLNADLEPLDFLSRGSV